MPQLLQADHFQDPDDPAARLATKKENKIAKAIAAGLAALSAALDQVDLKSMVAGHNTMAIAGVLGGPSVSDALKQAYKPVTETFVEAAELETGAKLGAVTVYDPLVAAGQLAGQQQTFIGSILGNSAETIRQQLLQALRMGAEPEKIAEALKAVVGLTPRQAQAVTNFRRYLENGDPQALVRAMRDPKFDPIVRSWLDGAPVKQELVDKMVAAVAENHLKARALTIAQNESMKAAVGGMRDAYVQAVGAGRLLDSEVTRFWQVVLDERLCPICAAIPILNPKGVSVLQPYLTPEGPLMAPLAHVKCRCSEKYVTDLSRVAINPFTGRPFPAPPGAKMPVQLPTIHL